jgi:hypothetical protein
MRTYGTLELTEASPAQIFVEPITLAQAKTFLRVEDSSPADPDQDELINGFIAAAREMAEILQSRDLIEKQYDLNLDLMLGRNAMDDPGFLMRSTAIYDFSDAYEIELRRPLKSVDLFRYRDKDGNYTNLIDGTDYIADLAKGIVAPPYGKSWPSFDPWPTSSILIRFTAGYPSAHPFWSNAGQRLIVGMKMLIEQWYDERLPFIAGNVSELPFAVSALLGYGAKNRVF